MSITVSTDVFCDGEDCSLWIEGVTGPRVNARDARATAKRCGWVIGRGRDLCPACAKRLAVDAAK
jgi:hypothetical protein